MNEIVPLMPNSELKLPTGSRLHANGLELPPHLEFDDWRNVIQSLQKETMRTAEWANALTWAMGDAINYGEANYGEKYAQWLDQTNYAYGSLANIAWVCREVPLQLRRPRLSFYQHQAVAPLEDPREKDDWLTRADKEDMSGRELSRQIAHQKIASRGGDPALYDAQKGVGRAAQALDDLNADQWAEVIWSHLLRPLRHLCKQQDYQRFLAKLRNLMKGEW